MLVLLTGPMFSGKTDELIRRARATPGAVVVKPALDTRHPRGVLVSHSGASIAARSVSAVEEVAALDGPLFVDEVQFFDASLAEALRGRDAVAAGLDLDFRREPFATTTALARAADDVVAFTATCRRCGRDATLTQRLVNGVPAPLDDPVVRVGDSDLYEPRCADCWAAERGAAPSAGRPRVAGR